MIHFTFNNAMRFLPQAHLGAARKTPSVEKLVMLALLVGFVFSSMSSQAGAGGTEFTQVYDQITGWANGTLGKTLGVSALLVGRGRYQAIDHCGCGGHRHGPDCRLRPRRD